MIVRFTPRALRDLNELRARIEKDSPKGAARVGRRIEDTAVLLETTPRIGTRLGRSRYRLVVAHTPYLIIYRIVRNEVQITTILHGRRRIRS